MKLTGQITEKVMNSGETRDSKEVIGTTDYCLWQRGKGLAWLQGYTSVNGGADDRNMEAKGETNFDVEDKK